jgi:hypothetical protein
LQLAPQQFPDYGGADHESQYQTVGDRHVRVVDDLIDRMRQYVDQANPLAPLSGVLSTVTGSSGNPLAPVTAAVSSLTGTLGSAAGSGGTGGASNPLAPITGLLGTVTGALPGTATSAGGSTGGGLLGGPGGPGSLAAKK